MPGGIVIGKKSAGCLTTPWIDTQSNTAAAAPRGSGCFFG